jgi:RNA polymerase primary sigma factor
LTGEEEAALAQEIEQEKRAFFDVLARSPDALGALCSTLEATDAGTRESDDPGFATMSEAPGVADILVAARRVRSQPAEAVSTSRAGDGEDAAIADFVDTSLRHGLSPGVLDAVIANLVALEQDRRGSKRQALAATISAIQRHRSAAERAKAAFVEANLGLVLSLASRRSRSGIALQDLVQDGTLGLMRAVDKFDYRRGIRFSTYAAWWIRHALNRALSDRSRTIRLPVHLVEKRQRLERFARELRQEIGREPTEGELSHRARIAEDELRRVASIPLEPVSLDAPVGPDNDIRLGDLVPDSSAPSAIDEISQRTVAHRLRHLLTTLPRREEEVLRLRFGLDRQDPLTLTEIGGKLSLSRERIRQLEARALSKLREQAATEGLDSHF